MGINKYNPEGYHDPTVYEALTHIEAERREERLNEHRYVGKNTLIDFFVRK